MAYFHIDRTQAYIQSLGFSDGQPHGIDDRSQKVVADAFPADNSFYSPRTRTRSATARAASTTPRTPT